MERPAQQSPLSLTNPEMVDAVHIGCQSELVLVTPKSVSRAADMNEQEKLLRQVRNVLSILVSSWISCVYQMENVKLGTHFRYE
jgi:hypothetical protein